MRCEFLTRSAILLSVSIGFVWAQHEGTFDPSAYSGGGGNTFESNNYYKTLASYAAPGEGLGKYASSNTQHEPEVQEHSGELNVDHHHGSSVVSLGQRKGITLDLTKHGESGAGDSNQIFGGSFLSDGKHESGGGGGGGEGHHVYHQSYHGESDQDYTALLAATLSATHFHEE